KSTPESHGCHQRDVRVAAQFRENLSPHKDRLIAGADFRNPRPKADHQTHQPEHRPRVVQLKIETTTNNPLILQCRTNIVERGWRKPGVGMKKKQHVAGPALRAEVHLSRPPTVRRVKFHADPLANLPNPVTALSFDNNQPVSAAAKILLKPNVDAGHMELAIANDYAPRMVDVFTGTLLQQRFSILTRIRSGL